MTSVLYSPFNVRGNDFDRTDAAYLPVNDQENSTPYVESHSPSREPENRVPFYKAHINSIIEGCQSALWSTSSNDNDRNNGSLSCHKKGTETSRSSCCIYLRHLSLKSKIFLFIAICSLVIVLIFVAVPDVCPYVTPVTKPLQDPLELGSITSTAKNERVFNILFFGDSMIREPLER